MSYFKTYEFVDRETYERWGEKSIWFIDNRIVTLMNKLREEFGVPITINNWYWGGDREWSGLRTPRSPYYSTYSQHSFGRAIDFLVKGKTADEVRDLIEEWYNLGHLGFEYNITMEYGDRITWVHIDIRNTPETPFGQVNKFYM